jgi:hypothetical protein
MLSCCIEPPPQYGQYVASFLVDIPITWNFILQLLHTNVAAIIYSSILRYYNCVLICYRKYYQLFIWTCWSLAGSTLIFCLLVVFHARFIIALSHKTFLMISPFFLLLLVWWWLWLLVLLATTTLPYRTIVWFLCIYI